MIILSEQHSNPWKPNNIFQETNYFIEGMNRNAWERNIIWEEQNEFVETAKYSVGAKYFFDGTKWYLKGTKK